MLLVNNRGSRSLRDSNLSKNFVVRLIGVGFQSRISQNTLILMLDVPCHVVVTHAQMNPKPSINLIRIYNVRSIRKTASAQSSVYKPVLVHALLYKLVCKTIYGKKKAKLFLFVEKQQHLCDSQETCTCTADLCN